MGIDETGRRRGSSTERFLDKETILRELDISPGQTILDVGCGDGYMSREFSRALNNTGKVYALDRPREVIEKLEKETNGTNISPIRGDITKNTGFEDSSIDLVYLSTVFHIFTEEQLGDFQNEAKRILRPGGKLAIVEIEKRETPLGPPQDMRVSPEELKQLIRMNPLSLVQVGEYFYMQTFENGED